ncbi:hypothetical protein ACFQVA_18915 [Actinomadura keratinilytica]
MLITLTLTLTRTYDDKETTAWRSPWWTPRDCRRSVPTGRWPWRPGHGWSSSPGRSPGTRTAPRSARATSPPRSNAATSTSTPPSPPQRHLRGHREAHRVRRRLDARQDAALPGRGRPRRSAAGKTPAAPGTLVGVAALDVPEHLVEVEATAVLD